MAGVVRDALEDLSDDDLAATISEAAKDYGINALWPSLPAAQQGRRDLQAAAVREVRRDAARALWLAAMGESHRRRADLQAVADLQAAAGVTELGEAADRLLERLDAAYMGCEDPDGDLERVLLDAMTWVRHTAPGLHAR